MRLFSKAPPSPQTRGTSPSSNKSPILFPRIPKVQSRRSVSQRNRDADPYALNSVHTAREYESDDSDAEIERMASRYDLNNPMPDDIAFDDCSNDRYSEVGRRLALMSNDSDSAQWRSFDEFDERDPKSPVYSPLHFDRDIDDWDDVGSSRQPNKCSAIYYRDDARRMRSLTDDAGEILDDNESPASASISSVLESEDDAKDSIEGTQEGSNVSMHVPVPLFRGDSVSEAASPSDVQDKEVETKRVIFTKPGGSNEQPTAPTHVHVPSNRHSVPEKQDQNNIVERVAQELKANKEKEQNKKDSIKVQKSKGFGLFRRKSPRNSDNHAESRPSNQQQIGSALETQSDSPAMDHVSENLESPVDSAPRSILKESSFVAPPGEDNNQDNDQQHKSEAAGVLGFFSSVFAGNSLESPATGETVKHIVADSCKQESTAPEHVGFLDTLCGLNQAVEKQSSDAQVSPDPVMGIRSPISINAVANEDVTLMPSETMKEKREGSNEKSVVHDSDENEQNVVRYQPDSSFCLRSAAPNTTAGANHTTTPIPCVDKTSKSRSAVVEDEPLVATEEYAGAGNEQVLVQCLRDNHCNGGADCVVRTVTRLDNLGCQQTFEFMDDFITAKDPKLESVDDAPIIEARALSLDAKDTKESGPRGWRKKNKQKQQQPDACHDDVHDLPIKSIEFPIFAVDQESASGASLGSFGGRRQKGLYVDTKLEQEMRQMQEELAGTRKKSLFGRIKRASKT